MPKAPASFVQVCFSHTADELVKKVEHENYTLGALPVDGGPEPIGKAYSRLQANRQALYEYIAKLEAAAGVPRTLLRRF